MNYRQIILACSTVLMLAGCNNSAIRVDVEKDINEAINSKPIPPPAVVQSLLPPVTIDLTEKDAPSLEEQKFDIAVTDISAKDLFLSLVMDTPINMVVHPSVKGTISLTLKDVTIDEVMEIIREVYGYEYKKTANGYLVLPITMQTRIFSIDYLTIKRIGTSQTKVSSGQLTQQGSSSNSDSDSSEGGGGGNQSSAYTTTTSDFWGELQTTLDMLIATPGTQTTGNEDNTESGAVVLNPQAGLAIVTANPDAMRKIEEYLQIMHSNLHRQVILEAKIIEVQLDDGFQTGIDWQQIGTEVQVSGRAGSAPIGTGFLNGILATTGTSFLSGFAATVTLNDFSTFIDLLDAQGNVQVLSSPRIATINNQKAVIKVGTDEYFVTKVTGESSATSDGTGSASNIPNIELTPFFSGIALDVTPHISAQDDIILHIHPSVSEVRDQTKTVKVSGLDADLPLALSSVRETDSVIRAKNGQIVVIGGLMTSFTKAQDAGVPGLRHLPIVGNTFRTQQQASKKTELIILLRPIVSNSESQRNYLSETGKRIKRIQNDMYKRKPNKIFNFPF